MTDEHRTEQSGKNRLVELARAVCVNYTDMIREGLVPTLSDVPLLEKLSADLHHLYGKYRSTLTQEGTPSVIPDEIYMRSPTFAVFILHARQYHKWTQADLAHTSGISDKTILHIEKGVKAFTNIREQTAKELCRGLGADYTRVKQTYSKKEKK